MDMPREIRDALIAHARFVYPLEACGLLAIDEDGCLRMAYGLTNIDRSATSYTVDPTEHLRALRHAERCGWSLGGVFHSHPGGEGYPSAADVAGALEPDWLYAVIGMVDPAAPEVRCFRIRDGIITEEPIVEGGRV